MAMTASAQFEIRSTTFGAGTGSVWIDKSHIAGLGIVEPKTSDVDLWGAPGAVGNPEYAGVRVVKIPVRIVTANENAAMTALQTLWTAWASSPTDITLGMRLGTSTFTVTGRPRGSTEPDLELVAAGIIDLVLRFDALNPAVEVA